MALAIRYELSQEADKDLEDIFDYTAGTFGIEQAIFYLDSFENTFNSICLNPKIGRERREIREGLGSLVKESHVIFYRVMKNSIGIVRILHVSRDIVKFFPPSD